MKKILLILIFVAVFIFGGYIFFSRDKATSQYTEQCGLGTETECFDQLTDCIEANSIIDYFQKKGIKDDMEGWPGKFTNEISLPVRSNFLKATLYSATQLLGGGDYVSINFINLGHKYCDLNDDNLAKIVSPISSADDALVYYLFKKQKLEGADGASLFYVFNESDYDELENGYEYYLGDCRDNFRSKMEGKFTEIKELDDGYLLTLIGFNQMYEVEFFEQEAVIGKNGIIKEKKHKRLMSCGAGMVF